jgi:hypothetical protein
MVATAITLVRFCLSIVSFFRQVSFAKVPPRHAAAVGASFPSPPRLATHFYPPDTKMWSQKNKPPSRKSSYFFLPFGATVMVIFSDTNGGLCGMCA